MPGPLVGYRIVDLTTMISGPYATMILGDQGADVIKVEAPGIGDLMRYAGPSRAGLSAIFLTSNRNKRSVILDLKTDSGKQALRKLVATADVLVQNFRPGAMARIGFDEDSVRNIKPDIIYTSISGYGDIGPYSHQRVYDPVIQAISGIMSLQGSEAEPKFVSTILPDKNTALTIAQAITAALLHRERTGEGQHIQLAMLDALVAWLWPDGMINHTYVGDGVSGALDLAVAYSDPMPTSDGTIVTAAISDSEWQGFCKAAEREDLIEAPGYKTLEDRMANLTDLFDLIRQITSSRTTADWLERLDANDLPCAPVNTLDSVLNDPQILANNIIEERKHPVSGSYRDPRPPVRYGATPADVRSHPPEFGEHTKDILEELGYTPDEIQMILDEQA